jgi:hypothetical protein
MDNEIQDELQRLIQEINRIRVNNRNINTNTNGRNRRNSENTEIIGFLRELMQTYNTNIREYQENTRTMLQIMYLMLRDRPTNTHTPIYENRNANINDYTYWFADFSNRLRRSIPTNTSFQENVIVSPTRQQIESATSDFNYSTETNTYNTNCPITLDDFQEDEPVTLIEYCGHLFRRDAIQNWFQRNVRCPVCRHDIRDSSTTNLPTPNRSQRQPTTTQQYSLSENDIYNTLRTSLTNSLSDIINEYNTTTDASQNLVYTFEFPIFYNDTSNNLFRRNN